MFVGDGRHPLDKQFYVGKYFGIPLYFHLILVIYLGFELLAALFQYRPLRLLWPVAIVLSVYAHELGHALSAARLGAFPRRIVLHLFGGVAEIPPGLNLRSELLVIAAGPAVSLALAVLFMVLSALMPVPVLRWFFKALYFINMILFVFNILPIYPLDGGQFFRQYMTLKYGKVEAIRRTLPLSMVTLIGAALFGIVFWGSFGGPFAFVIALFLLYINHLEWVRWQHLFRDSGDFWGNLNPFRKSGRPKNISYQKSKSQPSTFELLRARIFVWFYKKKAEEIMKKSDEIGPLNLSKEERELLDSYLDAKVKLRRKNYLN